MESIGGNVFDLSQLKKNNNDAKKEKVLGLVEKAMKEIISTPVDVTNSIQTNGLAETALAAMVLSKDLLQMGLTNAHGISAEQFVASNKATLLMNAVKAEMEYSGLDNPATEVLAVLYLLIQAMIVSLAGISSIDFGLPVNNPDKKNID